MLNLFKIARRGNDKLLAESGDNLFAALSASGKPRHVDIRFENKDGDAYRLVCDDAGARWLIVGIAQMLHYSDDMKEGKRRGAETLRRLADLLDERYG